MIEIQNLPAAHFSISDEPTAARNRRMQRL